MDLEMENRTCEGCGATFKVLATSKQRFHAARCEFETTGVKPWDARKQALNVAKKYREKPENLSTKQTPSIEKELTEPDVSAMPAIETPSASEVVHTTKVIVEKRPPEKPVTEKKTKNASTITKGSITVKTEKVSSVRSLTPVKDESPTGGLPALSENLRAEQLQSMNLINSSVKQLKTVLDSVVESNEESFESQSIHDICKVSDAIAKLMKVKVDAVKAATAVIKATKS